MNFRICIYLIKIKVKQLAKQAKIKIMKIKKTFWKTRIK